MSYGHAYELLAATGGNSPAAEFRVAVRKLKAWADLNPGLTDLYRDFEAALKGLDEFLAQLEAPR
jgi:HEF_HK domain